MPDYIIFDNWPLSMKQREYKARLNTLLANKVKEELDEKTQTKIRIMSIIDVLLRELESW